MPTLIKTGRTMFAAGITGLAMICIISKDFIVGRPPAWPDSIHINPAIAYVSAVLLVVFALLIITNYKGQIGATGIAILLLLLSVFRHLPKFMNDWVNAYKALALLGGAVIITTTFITANNNRIEQLTTGKDRTLIVAGTILVSMFFIASGYAHFKYADFVKTLIPDYIPFHGFWTYCCGICLLAGGFGILIKPVRPTAALLSGLMVLGWFLLLHIPRFISHPQDPSDRMGLFESFSFAGIFFVLAGLNKRN